VVSEKRDKHYVVPEYYVPKSTSPRHRTLLDRVEVGVGEGLLDTLLNPVVWRRIGNVGRVCPAGTAGEDADDATIGVSDDRPRIPGGGESAVLVGVRVDGYPHGRRANAVVVVFPDEGFDAGRATDGNTGGVAVLDDDETLFAVRVEHGRLAQLTFLDDVSKLHEAATRIFELGAGLGVRVHRDE